MVRKFISCCKKIVSRALLPALDSTDKSGFRILLYHSIGEPAPEDYIALRVSQEAFSMQMRWLKSSGFNILPLGEIVNGLYSGRAMLPRCVAITFDDGYRDNFTIAASVLDSLDIPATIFLTSGWLYDKIKPSHYWDYWEHLNMDEVKVLRRMGFEIGSHGVTHSRLNLLTAKEASEEIINSKQAIEDLIADKVSVFSYPHGAMNRRLKPLIKDAGYTAACSCVYGLNTIAGDHFALRRTEITGNDSMADFILKVKGGYDWIIW